MTLSHAVSQLEEFLRFPSISTLPEAADDILHCADWLAQNLSAAGLRVEIATTGGHPAVIARNDHKPNRRSVMIYGHYDVQPIDPRGEWISPPFEPRIKDGVVFARGAADNKGQIFAHICGIAETIHEVGELPVNLVLLIEGEEEIGSPHLESLIARRRDEMRCDVIVISDGGMVAAGLPTFTYGLRGIAACEIRVHGPASDLHSGIYGGAVANPIAVLARMIAALHDADGRVAVPGFYDEVVEVRSWEREAWRHLPLDDAMLTKLTGVSTLAGEKGYSGFERTAARPTAEVNGIRGGFQGNGTKTVIPREAFAKLTFRLVPDQQPQMITERVIAYLQSQCPPTARVEITAGHAAEPYLVNPHTADGAAAQRALRRAFPGNEVALIREGGSIPIVNTFKRVLGVETLLLGLALPDCRAHAPNENFPLANFEGGIRLNRALLEELAAI